MSKREHNATQLIPIRQTRAVVNPEWRHGIHPNRRGDVPRCGAPAAGAHVVESIDDMTCPNCRALFGATMIQ